MRPLFTGTFVAFVGLSVVACSGSDGLPVLGGSGGAIPSNGGSATVGGNVANGGNSASKGGAPSNGGSIGSGGTTSAIGGSSAAQGGGATTGGVASTNGGSTQATGGKSAGGASSNGGTNVGGTATGGKASTGGAPSAGGAATGGKASTGGAASAGGSAAGGTATGGKASTGGAPSAGGVATGGAATGGKAATGGAATGGAATGGKAATGGATTTSCGSITSSCTEANSTLNANGSGKHCGYTYEYWKDSGTGSLILKPDGYSVSWSGINNLLGRKGIRPGSANLSVTFDANYQPNGNSYLCVYGWTRSPLIEYYIVDSWGTWKPPGGTSLGTLTSDGGTYDIYKTQRVQQPSIDGTQTFYQYWSVRTAKRTCGTITVANHISAWAAKGMNMGSFYEVSMTVEGYQSSGTADVKMSIK